MSTARVALLAIQAVCCKLAWTPPNKTPQKARYHLEQAAALRAAPIIFQAHSYFVFFWTLLEMLSLFNLKTLPPLVQSAVCSSPHPDIRVTPLFLIGHLAIVLGAYIRLDCFNTLGKMFTFDLTVHPSHHLVTTRFYAYVRHPSYTGSYLMVAGVALVHFTRGAWLTECGTHTFLSGLALDVFAVIWCAWTLSVGVSRARAEDAQMQKLFGREWEAYAARVPWWFFPGIW